MKKFLFIITIPLLLFAEKGKVFIITGSDASNYPYYLVDEKDMLWSNQIYTDPSMTGYKIMSESLRNKYIDSFGNNLRMTWWMMGGNIYDISRNCNIPNRADMNLHLMKKYHFDSIQKFGDHLSFHYHNYLWSDPNGDGIYHWNMGEDFNLSKDDFEKTLCIYLIEENVFPVSFRSGWHFMDNDWMMYLEKFVPFDFSNAYPTNAGSTTEPSWWADWSQSPADFVPYHPNENNYQIEGHLKQWCMRSTQFQSAGALGANLEKMFQEAANGKNQMSCFWGHIAEGSFLPGLENLHNYAKLFSDRYGVEFVYCNDVEGFRYWLNSTDTIPPSITVNEIHEGVYIRFDIQTDGPVFQSNEPFVALKNIHEEYQQLTCTKIDDNHWETVIPIHIDELAKVAISVCDSIGNQSNLHLDFVPNDIFVDNENCEELSGNWQDYTSGQLWDLNARLLTGPGQVKIVPEIKESGHYKVLFHGPGSTSDNIKYTFYSDSDSASINYNSTLEGTDNWQKIGVFYFEVGTGNFITIENFNSNRNLGIDVVRFSPLIANYSISIDQDSIGLGNLSINTPTNFNITIDNNGLETLTINLELKSNYISTEEQYPIAIDPFGSRSLTFSIYNDKIEEIAENIILTTNDTNKPEITIPVTASFNTYFVIVDDSDSENYSEHGTEWFYSSVAGYGQTSRCAWILGNGFYAEFKTTLNISGNYDLSYIVPMTANAHDHAVYTIFVDNSPIDTLIINQNTDSGKFVKIANYNLPANKDIKVRIQDNGNNTNTNPSIVLRADAVKLQQVISTKISDEKIQESEDFRLSQNFPNPFNPVTHISYILNKNAEVRILIYDLSGNLIKQWHKNNQTIGNYSILWDATDMNNQPISSGIYFCKMMAKDYQQNIKMVFLK